MTEKKATNESLRDQLFKTSTPGRTIKKTLSNGIEVEVRQPTRRERNKIAEKARDGESFNVGDFADRLAIACTINPVTGNRVFRDSDYVKIEDMQNAEWFDELTAVVSEVLNVSAESMEKN
jgi:hypothetical protein